MTYRDTADVNFVAYGDKASSGGDPHADLSDAALVDAIARGHTVQHDLYTRFKRPLLNVFLQRRIDRDAAQDLLQRTFLQAIKKIRAEGLEDPANLGGYLYRTALNLATVYWRDATTRRQDTADTETLHAVSDEALSLEERVDHDILAKAVRALIQQLSLPRDREVLLRFYLHEEQKTSICVSLELSDLQFNQVLWRARQRLGEIIRKNGGAIL